MSPAEVVTANWTARNKRRMAGKEPMLVASVISGDDLDALENIYQIRIPAQTSPSNDPRTVSAGHCFCGKVQVELPRHLKPAISVVCHCHDCREWHSTGSVPYMMFPLEYDEQGTPSVPLKVRLVVTNHPRQTLVMVNPPSPTTDAT